MLVATFSSSSTSIHHLNAIGDIDRCSFNRLQMSPSTRKNVVPEQVSSILCCHVRARAEVLCDAARTIYYGTENGLGAQPSVIHLSRRLSGEVQVTSQHQEGAFTLSPSDDQKARPYVCACVRSCE